jgi:hypothetical protein
MLNDDEQITQMVHHAHKKYMPAHLMLQTDELTDRTPTQTIYSNSRSDESIRNATHKSKSPITHEQQMLFVYTTTPHTN